MTQEEQIEKTKIFVKETLKNAEGGHDWFHILRVFNNCSLISEKEEVDAFVVKLGALLHDIADSKFHNGDETVGPKLARDFLNIIQVEKEVVDHVIQIIENISYNSSLDPSKTFKSPELDVIQDADRLDALGAIGIARTFNYGGFKNRAIYNPDILPDLNMSKEAYKKSTAPTINHFYEKLLLLKDLMNTKTGKQIAAERHEFMEQYLEQFYAEWEGEK
ncbi:HD domain-containing protein [Formosa maritima]|uniref:HD domain-containing protein n=1 Tax=Formosa maritima TaxID=2592046 RepID=A0A5D0G0B2_9FLAO|nr:HD domain-containing protein [Formosa maritima]TYA52298.1 HD domain-containing protein [Formosa maritima]